MYSISNHVSRISVSNYTTEFRDAKKFIVFCKQCNKYNNCWACPPFEFDKEEYIRDYKEAYIIGTKIIFTEAALDNCSNSEESRIIGAEAIAEVRRFLDIQLLDIEKKNPCSKVFFAGTCHFCHMEDCTRIKAEPCRFPDKIRPSLESLGFDIGKTCEELLNIKLQWSSDGSLPQYLTLVSAIFAHQPIANIEGYFCFNFCR